MSNSAKHRINVITIHDIGNNFGSTLQACALCDFLTDEGFDVKLIDYKPSYAYNHGKLAQLIKSVMFFKDVRQQNKRFKKYFTEHCVRTKRYTKYEQLSQEKDTADTFLVGSDQLWNEFYNAGKDPAYYLEFTDCKNKVAYSASLGQLHTDDVLLRIKERTKHFKAIAVRERASCEQLHKIGMTDVKHVVDPVFLQKKEYYIDKSFTKPFDKYVLVYSVNNDELMDNAVQQIANRYGLKVVLVGGYLQKTRCDLYMRNIGPSEFANLINSADYVVANSFHATAMSIIFNKQFSVILSKNSPMRITDLLEVSGIEDRVISSLDEIDRAYKHLDYSVVNNRLQERIELSKKILVDSVK